MNAKAEMVLDALRQQGDGHTPAGIAYQLESLRKSGNTAAAECFERKLARLRIPVDGQNDLYFRNNILGLGREIVIANRLAEQGFIITVEPCGRKGPDLGIEIDRWSGYVEVKRLVLHEKLRTTDDDFWKKLEAVMRDGSRQFSESQNNILAVVDFRSAGSIPAQDTIKKIFEGEPGHFSKIAAVLYISGTSSISSGCFLNEYSLGNVPEQVLARLSAIADDSDSRWHNLAPGAVPI
ncbi:hypothetical protein O0235_06745 [Tepidiforma flava]|uniref:Restriction endonuclease n=1 Tax=Tepidiforma flava TaxID=3004094 RepID=A0ABY7MAE6_9CHLR|nr:hypothetical protein [Tepidiforma flava]WBL37262.1 hypothetical protein O0235_06745 [Tepidiforma flava]